MATKRKTTTAIVAGVTAAALLLGGTFAWTSISQQAKNEAIVDINPGGRLHDDFNGTNKDVYVENFGDTTTGVPIYARIRLDQYFEVGQDAGINKDVTDRKVNQLLGTDINNVETWVTYTPGETLDAPVQANNNWQWTLGNDDSNLPYYMPTFNMNKDSLAADINGTYEGTIEGDIVHYDDYKTYTDGQTVAGTEVYDWDDEDADEEENPEITTVETTPRDSADVYHKEGQEHAAKQISSTATVMTMEQWIAEGSQPGAFWVYDTDGWAYWAQAIEPGKTTGLLLDSISMSKVPDDNYYYGINVVGQFATKGDIYMFDDMSPEAEELFVTITGLENIVITGSDTIVIGETVTYTATRMALGGEAVSQPASLKWEATDADGNAIDGVSMTDGKLTVAETVPAGTQITVTATEGDSTATLAEGDETATQALAGSKVVTVLGTIEISANNEGRYTLGTESSVELTAGITGASTENGTISWIATDNNGDTLTDTTIIKDAEDPTKATLVVGSNETATKIIVTATYKLDNSNVEFSDNCELLDVSVVTTTDDMSAASYALLTDDGTGNGTYTMTLVRSYDEVATGKEYDGKEILKFYTGYEEETGVVNGEVAWKNDRGNITSVVCANTIAPEDTSWWFNQFTRCSSFDLAKLNTSGVRYMNYMFCKCTSLVSLDLSTFNVRPSEIHNMFNGCSNLKELNLSGLDTSRVTAMQMMFQGCSKLSIDCSNWNVSRATSYHDFNNGAPGVILPRAWQ